RGDVIVKYQGKSIEDPRGLQKEVIQTPVGTSVSILVVRESREQELRTKIAEQPSNMEIAKAEQDSEEQGLAGIKVEPVNSHTAQKFGIDRATEGVVVTAVALGSPAEQAGLARGDVIREVNRQPISSLEDYYQVANSLEEDEMALLFINRLGTPLFLTVKA
ncbi:MAG: PDZ domain-containing protein, partial [Nitrospirota bacterium]